jgi:hypothetical protein
MKKLITALAIIALVTSCKPARKYTITDAHGNRYTADFYNKTGDGCVLFNDKSCECTDESSPGNPIMICGSYTIVDNHINK